MPNVACWQVALAKRCQDQLQQIRRHSGSSGMSETFETVTPYDEAVAPMPRDGAVVSNRQVALLLSGAVGMPVPVSSAVYKNKRDVRFLAQRTDLPLRGPESARNGQLCVQTWEYRKIKISDVALIGGSDIQEPTIVNGVYHKEGLLFLQGSFA